MDTISSESEGITKILSDLVAFQAEARNDQVEQIAAQIGHMLDACNNQLEIITAIDGNCTWQLDEAIMRYATTSSITEGTSAMNVVAPTSAMTTKPVYLRSDILSIC